VDDEREWEAVARRVGVGARELRLVRQVHGTGVAVARAGTHVTGERPEADVIISDDPAVAIGVRVADCAAVLVGDRRIGVAGAAHAGWRGTAANAAAVLVRALAQTFGSEPTDLVAAIGPCLGPCCGEVGDEVVEAFREGHSGAEIARWFAPAAASRHALDLWGANRDQLRGAGVPATQIHVAELCTKTHAALFHSYREHGKTAGRMLGVIRARGEE
jgi:YfiH family protein